MNATSGPLRTELTRLSAELAEAGSDVERIAEIAGRLATVAAKITAACEREYVIAMEVAA